MRGYCQLLDQLGLGTLLALDCALLLLYRFAAQPQQSYHFCECTHRDRSDCSFEFFIGLNFWGCPLRVGHFGNGVGWLDDDNGG